MSWLSSFLHNPIDYIEQNPLKALGLLAAPIGLAAAPFLAPEIGAAGAGLFGAAEAGVGSAVSGIGSALGGVGEALGFGGAEATAEGTALSLAPEATAAPNSIQGLVEGPGGPFNFLQGGDSFGSAGQQALGFTPEAATGVPPGGVDAVGGAVGQGGADALGGAGKSALDAGGAEGGSFWDKIVGGAESSIAKNPLGIGLAGAGLGYNMLTGSRQSPEMKALGGQAAQLNAQQAQLMGYLSKGTLPPGLQQAVQNASAAAKANAISNAARNGQNTDLTENTALAATINGIDNQMIALIAQQGVALMNSGLQAAQISSQLYGMIEKINQQHAQSTGQAIANFAAALSGGPRINVIGGSNIGMAA